MTWVLLIIFSQSVFSQLEGESCFRLEGARLRGCSPQAKPAHCGPPKPCPPCTYFEECGTFVTGSPGGGGVCVAWGEPKCYDTPDGRVCDPAPCLEYTEPRCIDKTERCGYNKQLVPSTGTYSCSYVECRCPPPPEGLKDCRTYNECQESTPCD